MTTSPALDGPLTNALVGTRRFFTRSQVSDDKRSIHTLSLIHISEPTRPY